MCTLAVYARVFETAPLVIAANRDEFYDRPTAPPQLLEESPPIFGGRDVVRGGTWLGINGHGVASALLNRTSGSEPDPSLRSRGLLCVDALRHRTAREAIDAVGATQSGDYNPFNLLIADRHEVWVLSNNGRRCRAKELDRGLHLITNLDVDDPECPRIAASTERFAAIGARYGGAAMAEAIDELRNVLSDHGTPLDPRETGPGSGLCVHLGTFGTRSATVLILDSQEHWTYLHAVGAPCAARLEPVPLPTQIPDSPSVPVSLRD